MQGSGDIVPMISGDSIYEYVKENPDTLDAGKILKLNLIYSRYI
jgi:hypothetical protein